jgi:hypothetical protein
VGYCLSARTSSCDCSLITNLKRDTGKEISLDFRFIRQSIFLQSDICKMVKSSEHKEKDDQVYHHTGHYHACHSAGVGFFYHS